MFRRSPARWLAYAVWWALATSLAESAALARGYWLGYAIPEFQLAWWLPIGYLLMFPPVTALAVLMFRRRAPRPFYVGVLTCLASLGAFGLAIAVRKFHQEAALLLSIGVGVQLARAAARRSAAIERMGRLSLPVLALASALIAGGAWGRLVLNERHALATLSTADQRAPNVLLIVLDTVRAESLGLYGYVSAATPNLDRLARRGVIFDRALATAPWTLPSHASMFTGRWPHELHTGFRQPLDGRFPTLAERFARKGYLTAGFSANSDYGDREFGLSRGLAHFEGRPTTLTGSLLKTAVVRIVDQRVGLAAFLSPGRKYSARTAAENNDAFLDWLASRETGRPFFAFLNYFDAHEPYLVDDVVGSRFPAERRLARIGVDPDSRTPEDVRKLNYAYDATLASLDEQLGRLFVSLRQRGDLEHTIVVITADHGEHFGEHGGLLGHSSSLYTQLLHVPLFVSYPPDVPRNRHVQSVVTLRDLAATVLDLAGLSMPEDQLPGHSLRSCWATATDGDSCVGSAVVSEVQRGEGDLPSWYPTRRGNLGSIVRHELHYIRNYGDGQEELYDLSNDLKETRDLAATRPDDLAKLRTALERHDTD